MTNHNTIEMNIDYISRRVPQIINRMRAALKTKESFFLEILRKTNTDYEAFLKYKYDILNNLNVGSPESEYYKSNLDLHRNRYLLDPYTLLLRIEGKEANDLIEAYYTFDKDDSNASLDTWKVSAKHHEDPFVKAFDLKAPTLTTINICQMYSDYSQDLAVPKMLVKTLYHTDISDILNSNKMDSVINGCCIGEVLGTSYLGNNSEDVFDNRRGYSELLVGQISVNDILDSILNAYSTAYKNTLFNKNGFVDPETQNTKDLRDQLIQLVLKYQSVYDIPNCTYIEKIEWDTYYTKDFKDKIVKDMVAWKDELDKELNDNKYLSVCSTCDGLNKYAIYLLMEALFDNKSKFTGEEDKLTLLFINNLERNLEEAFESLISRSTISMIFTYCAKCGLQDYSNPLEVNQEFIKSLMNETIEDVAAINDGLKNTQDNNDNNNNGTIQAIKADDVMSRRKISDLTRKRLFDYLMISFIANNSNKKNYGGNQYFKDNKNRFNFDEISKPSNGSYFYNFVHMALQTIYGHQTIVSNFQQNIIGFKNGNYVYKNTLELGSQYAKKYINDLRLKEDIKDLTYTAFKNYYCVNDRETFGFDQLLSGSCLNNPNNYSFNSLKNHRAFASLIKILLKKMLKLYYITGTYQEICKKEVLLKVPVYIRAQYTETLNEVKDLSKKISDFINITSPRLTYTDEGNKLALKILQGGELIEVSFNPMSSSYKSNEFIQPYDNIIIRHVIGNRWWMDFGFERGKNNRDSNTDLKYQYRYMYLSQLCAVFYYNNVQDIATTQEFILDSDITRYLDNLSRYCASITDTDPELFAINPSLVASREEVTNIEGEVLQNNSYRYDFKKINENFKKYIDNTKPNELSIEHLSVYSLLANTCEKSLNKFTASLEAIKEFEENNNEFEYLWTKAIDRYRLN